MKTKQKTMTIGKIQKNPKKEGNWVKIEKYISYDSNGALVQLSNGAITRVSYSQMHINEQDVSKIQEWLEKNKK